MSKDPEQQKLIQKILENNLKSVSMGCPVSNPTYIRGLTRPSPNSIVRDIFVVEKMPDTAKVLYVTSIKDEDAMDNLTWKCHICGQERPDNKISVNSRDINEGMCINVRHCNDNPECAEKAKTFSFMKQDTESPYEKIIAEIDRFPWSYEDTVEIRARLESLRSIALEALKEEEGQK